MKLPVAHVALASKLVATLCGVIECQEAGSGVPLLACMEAVEAMTQGMASRARSRIRASRSQRSGRGRR